MFCDSVIITLDLPILGRKTLAVEPTGTTTLYVNTAVFGGPGGGGLVPPLQPVAETASDFTVSKHGSPPKYWVNAGIMHEDLPTQAFSIRGCAPIRSQVELFLKPSVHEPVGVPKLANLIDLIVPPPSDVHESLRLPCSATLPQSPLLTVEPEELPQVQAADRIPRGVRTDASVLERLAQMEVLRTWLQTCGFVADL